MSEFFDIAYSFNREKDYNCAESILLAAGERYGFEVSSDELHQVSAFGGGMGCGNLCGAIAGCIAVLGRLAVKTRAHATDGFKPLCADLTNALTEAYGGCTLCSDITPRFRTEENGCAPTIAVAFEVLDAFLKKTGWCNPAG